MILRQRIKVTTEREQQFLLWEVYYNVAEIFLLWWSKLKKWPQDQLVHSPNILFCILTAHKTTHLLDAILA